MADDNKFNDDDKNPKKGGEFKVPPRTWVVWIAIISGIIMLVTFRSKMETQPAALLPRDFKEKISSNLIASISLSYDPQSAGVANLEGSYYKTDEKGEALKSEPAVPFRTQMILTEELANKLNSLPTFEVHEPNQILLSVIWSVLPIIVIAALIWFFFIRQIKMAGKGALSFGKSKARLLAKERNKTTFKDVAGIEEAIEEVSELVEFLKDPKKFQRLGGRIPEGRSDGRPAGHGQDAAGQGHRRRSRRRVLQHQRLGFRGNVRRRRRQPRARHVRAGAQEHAVPGLH